LTLASSVSSALWRPSAQPSFTAACQMSRCTPFSGTSPPSGSAGGTVLSPAISQPRHVGGLLTKRSG